MLSKNYSSSINKTTNAPLDQNSSVEEFEKRCAFTCLAQKRVHTLCLPRPRSFRLHIILHRRIFKRIESPLKKYGAVCSGEHRKFH